MVPQKLSMFLEQKLRNFTNDDDRINVAFP